MQDFEKRLIIASLVMVGALAGGAYYSIPEKKDAIAAVSAVTSKSEYSEPIIENSDGQPSFVMNPNDYIQFCSYENRDFPKRKLKGIVGQVAPEMVRIAQEKKYFDGAFTVERCIAMADISGVWIYMTVSGVDLTYDGIKRNIVITPLSTGKPEFIYF